MSLLLLFAGASSGAPTSAASNMSAVAASATVTHSTSALSALALSDAQYASVLSALGIASTDPKTSVTQGLTTHVAPVVAASQEGVSQQALATPATIALTSNVSVSAPTAAAVPSVAGLATAIATAVEYAQTTAIRTSITRNDTVTAQTAASSIVLPVVTRDDVAVVQYAVVAGTSDFAAVATNVGVAVAYAQSLLVRAGVTANVDVAATSALMSYVINALSAGMSPDVAYAQATVLRTALTTAVAPDVAYALSTSTMPIVVVATVPTFASALITHSIPLVAFTEDFGRPDSAIVGNGWTQKHDDYLGAGYLASGSTLTDIASSKLAFNYQQDVAVWIAKDTGIANGYLRCDVTLSATRSSVGPMFRSSGGNDGVFVFLTKTASRDQVDITTKNGIFYTTHASFTSAGLVLGHTYVVEVYYVGPRIRIYLDGVLYHDYPNLTTFQTNTWVGAQMYMDAGTNDDASSTVDNIYVREWMDVTHPFGVVSYAVQTLAGNFDAVTTNVDTAIAYAQVAHALSGVSADTLADFAQAQVSTLIGAVATGTDSDVANATATHSAAVAATATSAVIENAIVLGVNDFAAVSTNVDVSVPRAVITITDNAIAALAASSVSQAQVSTSETIIAQLQAAIAGQAVTSHINSVLANAPLGTTSYASASATLLTFVASNVFAVTQQAGTTRIAAIITRDDFAIVTGYQPPFAGVAPTNLVLVWYDVDTGALRFTDAQELVFYEE